LIEHAKRFACFDAASKGEFELGAEGHVEREQWFHRETLGPHG